MHDLIDGTRLQAVRLRRATPRPAGCACSVPLTGGPMLVDFNEGAADVFADRSGVVGRAAADGRRDHRAAPAAAARAGRAGATTTSRTARMEQHFRPTMTDPGLRRRHREPLLRRRRRRRVGGAVVLGQRLEVGQPTGRRFRCCSPRRCCRCRCSCGSTRATATGWTARSASTATTATWSGSSRSTSDASLYRGTLWIDRADLRARPGAGGAERPVRAGRLERGDPELRAGGHRSANSRSSCSPGSTRGRSC